MFVIDGTRCVLSRAGVSVFRSLRRALWWYLHQRSLSQSCIHLPLVPPLTLRIWVIRELMFLPLSSLRPFLQRIMCPHISRLSDAPVTHIIIHEPSSPLKFLVVLWTVTSNSWSSLLSRLTRAWRIETYTLRKKNVLIDKYVSRDQTSSRQLKRLQIEIIKSLVLY